MLSAPQTMSAKKTYLRYSDGDLSFEDFLKLSQYSCWYCGSGPSNKCNWYLSCLKSKPYTSKYLIDNGDFIYNGLDRIDNNKTHNYNNVVPCCFNCNRAKNNMSLIDFKNNIINMISFRSSNYYNDYKKISIPNFIMIQSIPQEINISKKIKAIPGAIFGKLTVLKEAEKQTVGKGIHKRNRSAFLCRCECGKEKIILAMSLQAGSSTSCNDGLCRGKNTPQISSAKKLWNSQGLKKEGLPFDIFYQCSQMNCQYCGSKPSNSYASDRSKLLEHRFIYNGLDRIDSSKTHTINNVVPCCWNCNRMKSNRSLSEFNTWLDNINNNFLQKYNNV